MTTVNKDHCQQRPVSTKTAVYKDIFYVFQNLFFVRSSNWGFNICLFRLRREQLIWHKAIVHKALKDGIIATWEITFINVEC